MSFQQGLSGLNATSKSLEIIGNNIANANTYGSKASRAEFSDVYAAALNGGGASQVGIGVQLAKVSQQFTQGNITTTENALDLAVNGSGFFQVREGNQTVYTRNGQFKVDRDGFIVNNQKQRLMGYPADGTGVIQPGQATAMQLPSAGINPAPTSEMLIEMNLDSRVGTTTPAAGTIDFSDPRTYNNATSLTVFDAKGQDIAMTYYFQKSATDTWNVYATANGSSVLDDGSGNALPVTTITFPSTGGAPLSPAAPVSFDIPAGVNAAGADTLALTGVTLDLSGATQYGATFGVTDLRQDGYAPGQLSGIAIEDNGIVMARYSNGQSKPAGQIELANFRNPQGLQSLGGNAWARSFASGDPILGVPSEGNMGSLQSGALEEANIDLTAELVNMITAQRIYQANAQTIKTQDQVLQTLVNLR
ncbi:flagellar hook protein FlgE [Ideonella sp. BN130291]|uniref:flagellar hook protein FlgE n=1 Tax=Ideonella sp. BN130291 TaxID=3112940 RepID=UPI002E262504|nr:flagellar hook protein FlgE [Ideonella sp. BN130291]